jgi:hypothetical protein
MASPALCRHANQPRTQLSNNPPPHPYTLPFTLLTLSLSFVATWPPMHTSPIYPLSMGLPLRSDSSRVFAAAAAAAAQPQQILYLLTSQSFLIHELLGQNMELLLMGG